MIPGSRPIVKREPDFLLANPFQGNAIVDHAEVFSADPERAKSLDSEVTELDSSRANPPARIPFLDGFGNRYQILAFFVERLSATLRTRDSFRNPLDTLPDAETAGQDSERTVFPLVEPDREILSTGGTNEANGLRTGNFLH